MKAPTSDTAQCPDVDLGWALGTLKRAYLGAAENVVAQVPGGPRGYLVLVTAGRGEAGSQLPPPPHPGGDPPPMKYLPDDPEEAGAGGAPPGPARRPGAPGGARP